MSVTGDQDPIQEVPEGEVAGAAEVGEGMGLDLGPEEGDAAPGASEPQVAEPRVAECLELELGPKEVEGAQALVLARAPESTDAEEDSDIGPAEEEPGDLAESRDIVVDARHFPMAGFRFMFLDLVHSLLHRIYYNDHLLIRPHIVGSGRGHGRSRGAVMVSAHSPAPDGSGEIRVLQMPQRPRGRAASWEGQGEGLGPGLPVAAMAALQLQEPTDDDPATRSSVEQAEEVAEEEQAEEIIQQIAEVKEISKYQYGNWSENDEDFGDEDKKGAEEQKKKENENQEEPEKDPDKEE